MYHKKIKIVINTGTFSNFSYLSDYDVKKSSSTEVQTSLTNDSCQVSIKETRENTASWENVTENHVKGGSL